MAILQLLEQIANAKHVNLSDGTRQIEADRQNKTGRIAVARIEDRSIPDPQKPGLHRPVKRIIYKRSIYFNQDGSDYNHSWKNFIDLPANTPLDELEFILECLTLYAKCLPKWTEFGAYGSFARYIDSPEEFVNDMRIFYYKIPSHYLSYAAQELKLAGNTHNLANILEKSLGLDGAPSTTLANLVNHALFLQQQSQQKTTQGNTMPTEPSAYKRALNIVKTGAQKGAIGATNRFAVQRVITAMGDKCPDFLKTEVGLKALEGAMPFLVMVVADLPQVQKVVPAHMLKRATNTAEIAMENFASDGADKLFEAIAEFAMPILEAYMTAGGAEEGHQITENEPVTMEQALGMDRVREPELAISNKAL